MTRRPRASHFLSSGIAPISGVFGEARPWRTTRPRNCISKLNRFGSVLWVGSAFWRPRSYWRCDCSGDEILLKVGWLRPSVGTVASWGTLVRAIPEVNSGVGNEPNSNLVAGSASTHEVGRVNSILSGRIQRLRSCTRSAARRFGATTSRSRVSQREKGAGLPWVDLYQLVSAPLPYHRARGRPLPQE
jgi:hypothetical protein